VLPGHGEGDLIKRAGNACAAGVRVARTSRRLARLDDATAAAARLALMATLRPIATPLRQTVPYAPGKQMTRPGDLIPRRASRCTSVAPTAQGRAAPSRTPTA
jgi:hypothetical protein